MFDHRGCAEHANKEYTGPKAGNENDEMSIKVHNIVESYDDRSVWVGLLFKACESWMLVLRQGKGVNRTIRSKT